MEKTPTRSEQQKRNNIEWKKHWQWQKIEEEKRWTYILECQSKNAEGKKMLTYKTLKSKKLQQKISRKVKNIERKKCWIVNNDKRTKVWK
jgi:hypothetical protein